MNAKNTKKKDGKRYGLPATVFILGIAATGVAAQQPDNNPVTFALLGATLLLGSLSYWFANRSAA